MQNELILQSNAFPSVSNLRDSETVYADFITYDVPPFVIQVDSTSTAELKFKCIPNNKARILRVITLNNTTSNCTKGISVTVRAYNPAPSTQVQPVPVDCSLVCGGLPLIESVAFTSWEAAGSFVFFNCLYYYIAVVLRKGCQFIAPVRYSAAMSTNLANVYGGGLTTTPVTLPSGYAVDFMGADNLLETGGLNTTQPLIESPYRLVPIVPGPGNIDFFQEIARVIHSIVSLVVSDAGYFKNSGVGTAWTSGNGTTIPWLNDC